MKNISAMILAAGESKRMGFPKPMLACDDGKTLLEHQVLLFADAGIEDIIVVVGAGSDEVMKKHAGLKVTWAVNKNWRRGQFSSLQTGLKIAAAKKTDGTFVLPVDVAGVSKKTVLTIIENAQQKSSPETIIPEFESRGGHPVYLSKIVFKKLLAADSASKDARLDIELKKMTGVVRLSVNDPAILKNVNTPNQWERCES